MARKKTHKVPKYIYFLSYNCGCDFYTSRTAAIKARKSYQQDDKATGICYGPYVLTRYIRAD